MDVITNSQMTCITLNRQQSLVVGHKTIKQINFGQNYCLSYMVVEIIPGPNPCRSKLKIKNYN